MPFSARYRHTYPFLAVLVLSIGLLAGCEAPTKTPTRFQEVSAEAGIDFRNDVNELEDLNILQYLYFYNGGGVAAGDINNDGLPDLYFTSNQEGNRLFLNEGNWSFRDITDAAGVEGDGDWTTGTVMVDINGDQLLDIYVCEVSGFKGLEGRNRLFINNGDLTFSEQAKDYGLDFAGYGTHSAFFDYDKDGDLDVYLLNHAAHTVYSYGKSELRFRRDSLAGDRLLRHDQIDGKSYFTNVTSQAGIYSSHIGYGLGIALSDLNGDGWEDIYIGNDFHENDYLYLNNQDGTFTESLESLMGHTSRFSMGNDAADLNNDGRPDVVSLDMMPFEERVLKTSGGIDTWKLAEIKRQFGYNDQFSRNTLQVNLGDAGFVDNAFYSGVAQTDWSWSVLVADYDNDRAQDMFITNGIYRRPNDMDYVSYKSSQQIQQALRREDPTVDRELIQIMPQDPMPNFAYKNVGGLKFEDVGASWGLSGVGYSNGAAYADLDNDGDLDLVVNNINDRAWVFKNGTDGSEPVSKKNFIQIRLEYPGLNRFAMGARVEVWRDGQRLFRENFTSRGFLSSVDSPLHFGLGDWAEIDSVRVQWPDLTAQVVKKPTTNQLLHISYQPGQTPGSYMNASEVTTLFQSVPKKLGLDYVHRENDYVDFDVESLIPHMLSREGPAVATADVNGDGKEDLFLGGASGSKGAMFIWTQEGFVRSDQPGIDSDYYHEDVDASFFDVENDGDMDLLVVSGGNQVNELPSFYNDRIYLNDGAGNLEVHNSFLPPLRNNATALAVADVNGDGFTDVFVGSGSVPGRYGELPRSHLLINERGQGFSDRSESLALDLSSIGMVKDAAFLDFDSDGDADLLVVGEWMPLTLLENNNGNFRNVTSEKGLRKTNGWWSAVEVLDIDNDGDVDFLAGNLGGNSILNATESEPLQLYVKDFDTNGSVDPILAYARNGMYYPVASRDELIGQIASMKKQFPAYKDYADQTVENIFGDELTGAGLLEVHTLGSCLAINNGGTFELRTLPDEVQWSLVNTILSLDANDDGNTDVLIGGNQYATTPYFGKYDSSFGWLLLGDGMGDFDVVPPHQSGLRLRAVSRELIQIESENSYYIISVANNDSLTVYRRNDN